MKGAVILRVLVAAALVLLVGWVIHQTYWVDVEVDDPVRGLAATDPYYSLRKVLASAGATLEERTALEPMPPKDATLVLESALWDIFPERDARLKAWVEAGGHLVVAGGHSRDDSLRWMPLTFAEPHRRRSAKAHDAAASDADDEDDDPDDDAPATRKKLPQAGPGKQLKQMIDPKRPWQDCADFEETDATTQPAYEPGRIYRGCTLARSLRPLNHVAPTWLLTGTKGTLAMRVPFGGGSITGVSSALVTDNQGLLSNDNGLIVAAILQAAPGRAVWIIDDEAREPLQGWLWHEARTPLLLALAAIALALWRLMARFGPRETPPPQARRSMGEQVSGTGQFIAGTDAQALHAATRKAFEDVARTRVEAWAERDDAERVAALADAFAPTHAIDRATLLASMNVGSGATTPQILAAIAVLEQARRALLRAPTAPPPPSPSNN